MFRRFHGAACNFVCGFEAINSIDTVFSFVMNFYFLRIATVVPKRHGSLFSGSNAASSDAKKAGWGELFVLLSNRCRDDLYESGK
jgi:hypothetical protein